MTKEDLKKRILLFIILFFILFCFGSIIVKSNDFKAYSYEYVK